MGVVEVSFNGLRLRKTIENVPRWESILARSVTCITSCLTTEDSDGYVSDFSIININIALLLNASLSFRYHSKRNCQLLGSMWVCACSE